MFSNMNNASNKNNNNYNENININNNNNNNNNNNTSNIDKLKQQNPPLTLYLIWRYLGLVTHIGGFMDFFKIKHGKIT